MLTWDKAVIVQPGWQHGLDVLLLWIHANTCCHKQIHTLHTHTVSCYSESLVQEYDLPSLLAAEPLLCIRLYKNHTPDVCKAQCRCYTPLH